MTGIELEKRIKWAEVKLWKDRVTTIQYSTVLYSTAEDYVTASHAAITVLLLHVHHRICCWSKKTALQVTCRRRSIRKGTQRKSERMIRRWKGDSSLYDWWSSTSYWSSYSNMPVLRIALPWPLQVRWSMT